MPSKIDENLPETNEGYGTHEYWEQRYAREGRDHDFDWFLNGQFLLPIFEELTKDLGKETRMLMLGCGNSNLSEVLYDAGWHNIVNVDYSGVLIRQMTERHADTRPDMQWLEMDVMDLKFPDGDFDLIVDKGTMDAMLTTKGDPWNPNPKDVANCTREVDEGVRVLRKRAGSKFVYFTFGQPHFRKRYFQDRPGWTLSHATIGPPEGFDYFQYLLEWDGAQ